MIFVDTKLRGAYLIELEKLEEERGFFARTFCRTEFEAHGLNPDVAQCSISFNSRKGILRGMHYQVAPHQEAKLVRCTAGAIYDVIIDLRPDSATYCQWLGVELSAHNHRSLYIPEDFAHGFQVLADKTIVFYQMSDFYHPESARGARWDDPAFGIEWPLRDPILSKRDRTYPLFQSEGRA